ncbi:cbb3-type cytochrome oxidase assembly protein CcoS [Pseudocolwellia sp. AS88]|jgi:cbb3-type cytochrome oxidase maturation protein|uniref:cbb3-type cytochrome oxidase assembly protein CcoS n=1 Tax=Pseudocolwellia TaxID=2848177 RepID=UPI0026F0FA3B|nr:cbb3-type cytochrome oxidase assembly protein CcoS [Pseudocolwellia sp. AS88]MDO7085791.1 cbb3-type cytochrome oxidase assembly protein CcoS [Pseudocolwellia sp. AS88]
MSIIYVLIPIAVLLTAIGLYLFFWAVKTEQFDDLEKQGLSILFDDEKDTESEGTTESNTTSSQNHNNQSKDN